MNSEVMRRMIALWMESKIPRVGVLSIWAWEIGAWVGGFFFVMISESMSKVRGLLVQNRVFSLRIGLFK